MLKLEEGVAAAQGDRGVFGADGDDIGESSIYLIRLRTGEADSVKELFRLKD